MSNSARAVGTLERTGLSLSLVILRGTFTNMLVWVDDRSAPAVETGLVRLRELLRGRVAEISDMASDDWPHEQFLLRAYVAGLADDWADASADHRRAGLRMLIGLISDWLVQVDRCAS